MNHRRWLNARHKFRLCRNRFDGSVETRNPPLRISGTNVLQQVQNFNIVFGKEPEVEERGKNNGKVTTLLMALYNGEKRVYFLNFLIG